MSKIFKTFLIILLIISTYLLPFNNHTNVFADTIHPSLKVKVNDKAINFHNAHPFIDYKGRVQASLRYVGEALYCTVSWDETTNTAHVTNGITTISFKIDSNIAYINGQEMIMDTIPLLISGRTYVPVKYFVEAFGCEVQWNAEGNFINILNNKKIVNGYIFPENTEILGGNVKESNLIEFGAFTFIDEKNEDINYKRYRDIADTFASKHGQEVGDIIYNHISQKSTRDGKIPGQKIYLSDEHQWIEIGYSQSGSAIVSVDIYYKNIDI